MLGPESVIVPVSGTSGGDTGGGIFKNRKQADPFIKTGYPVFRPNRPKAPVSGWPPPGAGHFHAALSANLLIP